MRHSMKGLEKWSSYDKKNIESERLPYNVPLVLGTEQEFVLDAIRKKNLSTDGFYTKACAAVIEELTGCLKAVMTTSCTDALEMAAILSDIQPGDEVIMASYNFVSAANAFVLRGAKIKFVDIDPQTMNLDPEKTESAISQRTKAIVVMHYAGVACEMDYIMSIAEKWGIIVIEDAAHCIGAHYQSKHLGAIGHLGTLSFHDTKNIQCGEGGALLINDERFLQRSEVLKDKGTDRKDFLNGLVNKYTWVDIGSSFGLSELCAAFLLAQLKQVNTVNEKRIDLWQHYYYLLNKKEYAAISSAPANGHMFFVKLQSAEDRPALIEYLKKRGITVTSHYEPLHNSRAGKKYGSFYCEDEFTSITSKQLVRLPLYYDLTKEEIRYIVEAFTEYYEG